MNKTAQRLALFTFILVEHLADQGRDPLSVLDGGSIGREALPAAAGKYHDLFLPRPGVRARKNWKKVMRRLTQLASPPRTAACTAMPPMHRFLDVCLSVQHDRNLSANLHADLPVQAPVWSMMTARSDR
ncbi:hypothetical protein ACPA9J_25895 [Pseudomonas aeruginosa]